MNPFFFGFSVTIGSAGLRSSTKEAESDVEVVLPCWPWYKIGEWFWKDADAREKKLGRGGEAIETERG